MERELAPLENLRRIASRISPLSLLFLSALFIPPPLSGATKTAKRGEGEAELATDVLRGGRCACARLCPSFCRWLLRVTREGGGKGHGDNSV